MSKEEDFNLILKKLKIIYEDYWKNINQINTSIKLPLTILLKANQYNKIQILENNLSKLDLVSSFEILKFNNENIYFKIIYNGSPNKFIDDMKEKNVEILGCSADPPKKQKKFCENKNFPYFLLSDENHEMLEF